MVEKYKTTHVLKLHVKKITEEHDIKKIIMKDDVEAISKYEGYELKDELIKMAIYMRAKKVLKWLINSGVRSSYEHLKDTCFTGQLELIDILLEGGADIHYNNDEILFFISYYYTKAVYEKTKLELPVIIEKYGLKKTGKNCGFKPDTADTQGDGG
jgi:hypothetical protein